MPGVAQCEDNLVDLTVYTAPMTHRQDSGQQLRLIATSVNYFMRGDQSSLGLTGAGEPGASLGSNPRTTRAMVCRQSTKMAAASLPLTQSANSMEATNASTFWKT